MTAAEIAEAERLMGTGMLHARMLPLLRAALEHISAPVVDPHWYCETCEQNVQQIITAGKQHFSQKDLAWHPVVLKQGDKTP